MLVEESKTSWRGIVYYILAALFLLYEMGVQSSPSVMAQPLMHEFGLDAAIFGLSMGVYFYSYTLMQLPAGLVFDRWSAKWIIFCAALICSLGSLVFFMATGPVGFAVGRVIAGFGSAFAFVGVLVIAAVWFPARRFALLVGIAQMLAALGAMGGEIPLAYSIEHIGWRATVGLLVVIGAILALLILLVMRDPKPHSGCRLAREKNAEHRTIWTSLGAVFAQRQTYWIALYAFSAWAPIALFAELWGVPYLMVRFHITNVQAAVGTAVIWISLAAVSPMLGWLSDRIGRRCILLQICSLIGLITSVGVFFLPTWSKFHVFALLSGIGIAATGQILTFALVRENNDERDRAVAVGFNNVAVVIGGAIFQPAVGFLLRSHAKAVSAGGTQIYTAADYRFALAVIPMVYVLGWFASKFLIKETYCKRQSA